MRYSAFGKTHVGKVRDHNEDAFYVSENKGFFIVSDGMGGLASGEVASQITRDTITENLNREANPAEPFEKTLRDAFNLANRNVRKMLEERPTSKGMGCTCVVMAFQENDFYIAYVGDSRIYLYRNNLLKQISRDHSYVEELFLRGLITAEEKKDHPYKSSITRYVGLADTIEVDITSGPVANNDIFILCSDGLTGEVSDESIAETLHASETPEVAVEKLVQQALDNGGGDNISIIAVKVEKKKPGFFRKLFSW
ncbi:MAG TPA: Stp1/IreP family PP2C-type Ser/Thr phosphatase [Candidatus Rifleibacterium sp.]|nr:Stp1/IreP family PP2C-type Ser/Thr phosphatase [Candidatus Rifleibacterium sp.]HPT44571.1 Stp1/IreP family PP2C-type Ser/Thr phosphatase [Candidatus Rifleibacterium sp.]